MRGTEMPYELSAVIMARNNERVTFRKITQNLFSLVQWL
jgi:hypothetical protein